MSKKDRKKIDSYLDEKFIGRRGDYNKENRVSIPMTIILSILGVVIIAVIFILALGK